MMPNASLLSHPWWLADIDTPAPDGPVPTVGHESCRHREYRLTCRQYNRLLARAAGRCEVCGRADSDNCFGKLFIDHVNPLGKWAVRGLLCRTCNANIRFPSRHSEKVDAYYANAFYLTMALEAGLDTLFPDEPPMWTVLNDHTNRPWRREPEGWWPHHPRPVLVRPETWASLLYMEGPFHLSPAGQLDAPRRGGRQ